MIQHEVLWYCPLENIFNMFVDFLLVCNTHSRLSMSNNKQPS